MKDENWQARDKLFCKDEQHWLVMDRIAFEMFEVDSVEEAEKNVRERIKRYQKTSWSDKCLHYGVDCRAIKDELNREITIDVRLQLRGIPIYPYDYPDYTGEYKNLQYEIDACEK